MYCPQCGGTNEDNASFCSACGMDLAKYRQQWTSSTGQNGSSQPSYPPANNQSTPPPYQDPYQQPYQQQPYQQPYQAPYQQPYQAPYQQPSLGQGYMGDRYGVPRNVPSHMGFAIAATIASFFLGGVWPLGIVGIVYASQVGNKLTVGDYAGAERSSNRARTWAWVTLGVMVLAWIVIIIAIVAVRSSGISNTIY